MRNRIVETGAAVMAVALWAGPAMPQEIDLSEIERQMTGMRNIPEPEGGISSQPAEAREPLGSMTADALPELLTLPRHALPRDHREMLIISGMTQAGASVREVVDAVQAHRDRNEEKSR